MSIEIKGWIHQTQYSPHAEITYSFYTSAITTEYTLPLFEHTICLPDHTVSEDIITQTRMAAFDEAERQVQLRAAASLATIQDARQKWLALENRSEE